MNSDRPDLSGMFPRIGTTGSLPVDLAELKSNVLQQARLHQYNVSTIQVHWAKIVSMEAAVTRMANQLERISRDLDKVRWHLAYAGGGGAAIGGILTALIMKFLVK